jgi:hypothetical protein
MHLIDPSSPYQAPTKAVAVDASVLAAYPGEYEVDGKPALWIMHAGNRLMARVEGGNPLPLEASSPTRFASANGAVAIERVGETVPLELQLTQAGKTLKAVQRPAKPPVTLSPAQLQPFAGTYRMPNRDFVVTVEEGVLALAVGRQKIRLQAESESEFVAPALAVRVRFAAKEMHWTQLGSTAVAQRVD